jgi:GT2 family glycosyltransferase
MLSLGFEPSQISIIDDASEDGTDEVVSSQWPEIKLTVNQSPAGYISNRNRLMQESERDFVMSLDDDSLIRSQKDVVDALKLLESESDNGIFHFQAYHQLEPPPEREKLPAIARTIRSYIGCGHIIARHVIDEVGLYREEFGFYCEEIDFAIRARSLGYKTVTQEDLVVHHRVDLDSRSKERKSNTRRGVYGMSWRHKHQVSNNLAIVLMHFPLGCDMAFFCYYVIVQAWSIGWKKGDTRGYLKGLVRLISLLPFAYRNRKPMPYGLFFNWLSCKMF